MNLKHQFTCIQIGLCNTIYKIMSKTFSNRHSKVLPTLISWHQCAFIKGRTTADNALIGFEMFHYISKSKSKSNPIALKLDLSKAFDRVEWNLIPYILRWINFLEVFINLIQQCINPLLLFISCMKLFFASI